MRRGREEDFAAVIDPAPAYRGCRCDLCTPAVYPPDPPPSEPVTITRSEIDDWGRRVFGPLPTPP